MFNLQPKKIVKSKRVESYVNVGTIGHVDHGGHCLAKLIRSELGESYEHTNKFRIEPIGQKIHYRFN